MVGSQRTKQITCVRKAEICAERLFTCVCYRIFDARCRDRAILIGMSIPCRSCAGKDTSIVDLGDLPRDRESDLSKPYERHSALSTNESDG